MNLLEEIFLFWFPFVCFLFPGRLTIKEDVYPSWSCMWMTYSSLVQKDLLLNASKQLTYEFEMKDLGMMHYFLGLEVW